MVPNFAATAPDSWQPLLDRVAAAEDAGVDRIVVVDHVVFGERLEEYGRPEVGGTEGGTQPTGPDGHWLEPLTLLSVLAGRTSRVRLATGILIAALRRPVVLAKAAATLDVLSGGRLDLGVGVGWQREEYDAAGLSFEGRGRLLDHTLEVCQTLWRETDARYESPELQFAHIHQMPKPLQPGGVPIWVSGRINPRVIRRVVQFGSGWIPWGDDAKDPAQGVAVLRDALTQAGRDPSALQVTATLPMEMDDVPAMMAAGITDFRSYVRVPPSGEGAVAAYGEVVEKFRKAVGRA
jgi:probable F420-dependent oxidoreductase